MRTSRLAAKTPSMQALGEVIRTLRREQGLSQGDLGERADIHPTWISHIESGKVNPTFANLTRLSEGLGVRLSELIARMEEHHR
jgi:transcriptional regulator with XRE-family HTH domain